MRAVVTAACKFLKKHIYKQKYIKRPSCLLALASPLGQEQQQCQQLHPSPLGHNPQLFQQLPSLQHCLHHPRRVMPAHMHGGSSRRTRAHTATFEYMDLRWLPHSLHLQKNMRKCMQCSQSGCRHTLTVSTAKCLRCADAFPCQNACVLQLRFDARDEVRALVAGSLTSYENH